MINPDIKKNKVTPKPPGKRGVMVWATTTRSIATARRPSNASSRSPVFNPFQPLLNNEPVVYLYSMSRPRRRQALLIQYLQTPNPSGIFTSV